MDLLGVVNQINVELTQLQLHYRYLFGEQEPTDIFNSIVTCITDDLVDSITLLISRHQDLQQVLVDWKYDLRDKRYAERVGPKLQEILERLKQVPPGSVQLSCNPQWSRRFLSMDRLSRERALQYTIWSRKADMLQKVPTSTKKPKPKSALSIQAVDLRPLEFDFLKLATETKTFDKRDIDTISESVKKCIEADHIRGVLLLIVGHDRDHSLLDWRFELTSDLKLVRYGTSLEQILAIVKEMKGHPQLDVRPILTASFNELSLEEQQEAMKDTIWTSAFKKKERLG